MDDLNALGITAAVEEVAPGLNGCIWFLYKLFIFAVMALFAGVMLYSGFVDTIKALSN